MNKTILLTGASGFIGAAFLNHALSLGWRVRVITRRPNAYLSHALLEIVVADLSSTLDWTQALDGVEVVVHAAAELNNQKMMAVVNVEGPLKLLDAAIYANVKRWVQLSSVGAYGPVYDGLITEDTPEAPIGSYEITKTEFDLALKKAAMSSDIEVCIVRPSNVYGPNMRNQSIQHLINIISKGLFLYIGPPGASANYVHVDDVVQALELCVQNPKAANQIYIVSGWATLEIMINALASELGVKYPNKRISLFVANIFAIAFQKMPFWPLTAKRIKAMSLRCRYSTQKIENELNWKLKIPLEIGMSQLVNLRKK